MEGVVSSNCARNVVPELEAEEQSSNALEMENPGPIRTERTTPISISVDRLGSVQLEINFAVGPGSAGPLSIIGRPHMPFQGAR